jgi:hypothetical protein
VADLTDSLVINVHSKELDGKFNENDYTRHENDNDEITIICSGGGGWWLVVVVVGGWWLVENVGASTFQNLMGLHGLLQR